jgi:hypothetical protein
MTPEQFRRYGRVLVDRIAEYWELHDRHVVTTEVGVPGAGQSPEGDRVGRFPAAVLVRDLPRVAAGPGRDHVVVHVEIREVDLDRAVVLAVASMVQTALAPPARWSTRCWIADLFPSSRMTTSRRRRRCGGSTGRRVRGNPPRVQIPPPA